MLSNSLAMLFGIGILISMMGWGLALNHLPIFRKRADLGLQAGWGVALSVTYGGLLEITRTTSAITILGFLSAGFLYGLYHIGKRIRLPNVLTFAWCVGFVTIFVLFKLQFISNWTGWYFTVSFMLLVVFYLLWYRRHAGNPLIIRKINFHLVYRILLCAILLIVLYRFAAYVSINRYNFHDDFQGYFVFSKRMIESGTIGIDPFNARRLENGLGGQYFLNAFPLAAGFDEFYISLFEPGVAFLILVALVIFAPINHRRFAFGNLLIVLFMFFRNPPIVNISTLMTGIMLLVALYRTLAWRGLRYNTPLGNALLLALICSAATCVKSNFLIPVVFMMGISYPILFFSSRSRPRVLGECALCCALSLLFLLPWMISAKISSGTLFYPLLGHGFEASKYAYWPKLQNPSEYEDLGTKITDLFGFNQRILPFLSIITILLLALLLDTRRKIQGRAPVLATTIAGLLSFAIASHMSGYGLSASRYVYPYLVFLLIMLGLAITSIGRQSILGDRTTARMITPFALILTLGFFLGSGYPEWLDQQQVVLNNIFWRENNQIRWRERWRTLSADRYNYLKMQKSVPKGEPILARLDRPFLMNFLRNPIYVSDYPGIASPPPGMPVFGGSEALAQYLAGQSIRYVAYSYANEAGFSKRQFIWRLFNTLFPWEQRNTEFAFDFQDNLADLGKTRKRIYDDGAIFVIDLQTTTGLASTRQQTRSQLDFGPKDPFSLEQDAKILTGPFQFTHLRLDVNKREVNLRLTGQCVKKTSDTLMLFVHLRNLGVVVRSFLAGKDTPIFDTNMGRPFEAQATSTSDYPLGRGDLEAIGFGVLDKSQNRMNVQSVSPGDCLSIPESGYVLWKLDGSKNGPTP